VREAASLAGPGVPVRDASWVREHPKGAFMNIRFISSLTPEDEDRIAPGLLGAIGPLLDALPLAYTIRIETSNGKIFQHAHTGPDLGEQAGDVDVPQRAVAGLFRHRGPAS
jgi:hypothetical protein